MKSKTVKQHMRSIAAKGGKTTFKRHGRAYMSQLAKKRWAAKEKK